MKLLRLIPNNTNFDFLRIKVIAFFFSLIILSGTFISLMVNNLNYGIDFKGGTLIELRSNNTEVSSIRDILNNMNLGDVNVKKFGKEGDFLIKVEEKGDNNKLIPEIKKNFKD